MYRQEGVESGLLKERERGLSGKVFKERRERVLLKEWRFFSRRMEGVVLGQEVMRSVY